MPVTMRKMDVPEPVYEWMQVIKGELRIARRRNVTWAEVWEHIMEQQQAADQVKGAGR